MNKLIVAGMAILCLNLQAQEPDYSAWTRILQTHYSPLDGMDYEGLASKEWASMKQVVQSLAQVDTSQLSRDAELAYYLNLYNVTVVNLMMENRKVASIRDLSTDPFIRFNVFRKDLVQMKGTRISLKRLEDELIRERFQDPRIHFAINCAAKSCPPIRTEAYTGARLQSQLDDQARAFFAHPKLGVILSRSSDGLIVQLTKIMDGGSWFGEDFERWGGGRLTFLRKYLSVTQQQLLDANQGKVEFRFFEYDWRLNRKG